MASAETRSSPDSTSSNDKIDERAASKYETQSMPSQSLDDLDVSEAWGQLVVVGVGELSAAYDLVDDEYVIGRGDDCDIVLLNGRRPTKNSALWQACSKQHFKIYTKTSITGHFAYVEDLSTNGTIVNNDLVGKGNFTVLKSGDTISLVKKKCRAFLYLDLTKKEEADGIPAIVKEKYNFLNDLGSGACGLVKLVVRKSDCLRLACKCIEKGKFSFSGNTTDLMKEVRIITKLNHPCVIKILDVIDTPEMLCIFMELVESGDLLKAIRTEVRLDPDHAKIIFYQTCLAVKHLHENSIVHRDLKPENILLSSIVRDQQLVKVTDFGYSCVMKSSSLLHTICGTLHYIAPEIVVTNGLGGTSGYTKAVDCWSLGVILFVCITGQPAFTGQRKDMELRDQILQGNYALKDKYWGELPEAKDLVQKLLIVDPTKRLTVDEILKHTWFEDEAMLSLASKILGDQGFESTNGALDPALCEPAAKKPRTDDVTESYRSEAVTPHLQTNLQSKIADDGDSKGTSFQNSVMDTNSLAEQTSNTSEQTSNMSTDTELS